MRRVVFLFIMLCGTIAFGVACSNKDDVLKTETQIYYVDARLNGLLPYTVEIVDADRERQAMAVLDKLVEGWDDNENIRRIIPDKNNMLSVSVKNNIAYVDINSKLRNFMDFGRDTENLFVYQIVNSVASVKGIRFVKFTIDGEIHKDFMGFFDMRDTYKLSYPL